jgi:hypothetical protein
MAMKTLNLTILAYEGPIYRAYLSTLRALGYRAKRLIKLYNGRNRLSWLPRRIRDPFLYTQESLANNHWPRYFIRQKNVFEPIKRTIINNYQLSEYFFDILNERTVDGKSIAEESIYCDCSSEGFKSKNLFNLLKSLGPTTYLFTGGGLVPKLILELPSTQFVHIHPGYLPHVRGADGILWSTLLRGRPGAACFYMVPKLDEGPLILTEELDALSFHLPKCYDLKTLYRLAYCFYDPVVRAILLKKILEKYGTLENLETHTQNINQGITYHFMHDRLKEKVLRLIFD